MATGELNAGAEVNGRYRLEAPLGNGGFGAVWLAEDLAGHGSRVALKVLHAQFHEVTAIRARFEREAEVLTQLDHPNIARPIDWSLDGEVPYIAMEYVRGEPLSRELARRAKRGALFSEAEIIRIFGEICAAVSFAHAHHIVHRDLKPANIMLMDRAGQFFVKILDFGVAKALVAQELTRAQGTTLGTTHYMAPEQAKGTNIDPRADVFALGAVLFELITLRRAWVWGPGDVPAMVGDGGAVHHTANSDIAVGIRIATAQRPKVSACREGLPLELDRLVARAMAVQASDRFETVAALEEALRKVMRGERLDEPTPDLSRYGIVGAVRGGDTEHLPREELEELRLRSQTSEGKQSEVPSALVAPRSWMPWIGLLGLLMAGAIVGMVWAASEKEVVPSRDPTAERARSLVASARVLEAQGRHLEAAADYRDAQRLRSLDAQDHQAFMRLLETEPLRRQYQDVLRELLRIQRVEGDVPKICAQLRWVAAVQPDLAVVQALSRQLGPGACETGENER